MSHYSDILLQQGAAAAEAARQRRNVWADFAQNLSQLPAQVQQQQQRKELLNLEKAREQRLTASAEQEQALTGLRLQDAQRQTQGRAALAQAVTQLYESSRTQAERVEEALKNSSEFKNRMEGLKAASDTLAGPKQDEWQAFQKAYAGTHGAKTWTDLPAAQQQQAVADFAA